MSFSTPCESMGRSPDAQNSDFANSLFPNRSMAGRMSENPLSRFLLSPMQGAFDGGFSARNPAQAKAPPGKVHRFIQRCFGPKRNDLQDQKYILSLQTLRKAIPRELLALPSGEAKKSVLYADFSKALHALEHPDAFQNIRNQNAVFLKHFRDACASMGALPRAQCSDQRARLCEIHEKYHDRL